MSTSTDRRSRSLVLRSPSSPYVGRGGASRDETIAIASTIRDVVLVRPPLAQTLREVFLAYIEDLEARDKDAPSVRSAFRCWIEPAFGDLAPDMIDAARVALLVKVMLTAGRAANTVRSRCAFIRSALAFGERQRLIEKNPLPSLRGVIPPRRTRPDFNPRREILSVRALTKLACSTRVPHRDRVFYLVAGTCGLRVGELVELRLGDIDREAPADFDGDEPDEVEDEGEGCALHITRQWKRKAKRVAPPKGGGPRTIALRPDVLAVLDRWISVGWPRTFGRAPTPEDLLFPANEAGRRQTDRRILIRLHRHLKRVGLRVRRQHAFRHTFVSLLVNAGVPKDVAEQFTHPAPCGSIDIYAHYSYRVLHEAVRRIPLRLHEPTGQLELFRARDYRARGSRAR